MTPLLTKTFVAGGAIAKRRIVKPGTSDWAALQATASTEALIGVSGELDAASGDRLDTHLAGLAEVDYGGTVTRGDWLTSDTSGKAVTAAPATGVNAQVIGRAIVSGASGDVGVVLIAPSVIQG